jgi:hypothetical protein
MLFTVNTTAALRPVAKSRLAAIDIPAMRIPRASTIATVRGFTASPRAAATGPISAIYAECRQGATDNW